MIGRAGLVALAGVVWAGSVGAQEPNPQPSRPEPDQQPLVVTTAWLAGRLPDPRLVIFQVGDRAGYDAGHIPGAQFLAPTTEWSTPRLEGQLFLELPALAVLDSAFEARGISDESRVVVYVAGQAVSAATRALFTLEYAGLRGRGSILDGGLAAWKAEGRPLSTEAPRVSAGKFTPRPDSVLVVDAGYVSARLRDSRVRIVDARDTSFYHGRETGQGRNGHIPGAASFPFQAVLDSTGRFRPVSLLKAQFAEAGVSENQTVVTYCHIGQQATVVWFAARLVGVPARLYDGSFQDWAKRGELPVEAGRRP
ncbi:MAG: sulfurtransferase [Gemmatimonadales bacterium]